MFEWMFGRKRRDSRVGDQHVRDNFRELKVVESQRALLAAATQTADAANDVTHRLKSRLDDSVEQFETTARIMSDALIICDPNGDIHAFNPSAELLFGISTDEARTKNITDLIQYTTDGSDLWITEPPQGEGHFDGMRPDGLFRVGVSHSRLDRSDGSSIILLILRDVGPSDDTKYRSIFESSFDGIIVSTGSRIVAANPAASHLFGYSTEELLAKSLDELIFPASGDAADAIHQNGRLMEVYFTTTPITWDGEPSSLITIRDMSAFNDNADSNGPRMICCFGVDFIISYANLAFADHYNVPPRGLVGTDIRALMCDEERNLFRLHLNGLTKNDTTRRMKMRRVLRSGETSLQIWSDHLIVGSDGAREYQRVGQDLSEPIQA